MASKWSANDYGKSSLAINTTQYIFLTCRMHCTCRLPSTRRFSMIISNCENQVFASHNYESHILNVDISLTQSLAIRLTWRMRTNYRVVPRYLIEYKNPMLPEIHPVQAPALWCGVNRQHVYFIHCILWSLYCDKRHQLPRGLLQLSAYFRINVPRGLLTEVYLPYQGYSKALRTFLAIIPLVLLFIISTEYKADFWNFPSI